MKYIYSVPAVVALWCLLAGSHAAPAAEVIATNLDHPWSIAWLPDGRALVTEKSGSVRVLRGTTLDSDSLTGVPAVLFASQGGLFEALPDPAFATNGFVYLSYAAGTSKANATRVTRMRLQGNALVEPTILFEVAPLKDTTVHYGGRMAFLPDGTLLITTGDGFIYREAAQDPASLLGKVVRIRTDGSIPADNPFVGRAGYRAEIFTIGHRNPQGLLVDASGQPWLHEHGARGGDEINRLQAGRNYGWPAITRGVDYTGAKISPYTEWPGMEQPVYWWVPSIAPSGFAVRGANFYITGLASRALHRLTLKDGALVDEQRMLEDLGERLRDVRVGPDQRLWVLTDGANGKILRLPPP